MYFGKIDQLKADLIERPATEREVLPYLIATMLSWVLSMYANMPTDFGLKFLINLFISLFGTAYGIFWLYKLNNTKPNNYFLQRYFMLGWVILIRYFTFILIPMVILMGVLESLGLGKISSDSTSWSNILTNVMCFVFLYWYFAKHLIEVTQKAQY